MPININHGCNSIASTSSLSLIKNSFQHTSFFRSVLDSICKFFTGHPTEETIEKNNVQRTINQSIIRALTQEIQGNIRQPGDFGARSSVDIFIEEQRITLRDDPPNGVNLFCEDKQEGVFIPTKLKVQDLINHAVILNGGGDIDTNSVWSRIGEVDLNALEQTSLEKYQENGFFRLEQSTDENEFPLFGSVNGNIHLCMEHSLDNSQLVSTLEKMKAQASSLKGDSDQDHTLLMVLGIHNLQTKLPFDSDHYVLAAVSSCIEFPPVIVDSKNFAVYPKGIRVLRSGHQKATDAVSCGSHSLRAMNNFSIQLASGKNFMELTPPPIFNKDICNTAIDVNKFISELKQERIADMKAAERDLNPDDVLEINDSLFEE